MLHTQSFQNNISHRPNAYVWEACTGYLAYGGADDHLHLQIELIGRARSVLARIKGGEALLRGMSDVCGDNRMSFAQIVEELERVRLYFAFK